MPAARVRFVFRVAAVLVTLSVLMGSMVAATESGAACPTWPGCYPDQIGPELHLNPMVEFTHRVVSGLGLLASLAAGVLGLRDPYVDRWVRPLPFVAVAGGTAAAVFGALVVLVGIPTPAAVVDLCCALLAMAAAVVAAVRVGHPGTAWRWTRTAVGATACYGLLMVLHALGIVVAAPGSFTRVISWPAWSTVPADLHPGLQLLRLGLAGTVLLLGAVTVMLVPHRLRWPAGLLGFGLLAELVTGLVIRAVGLGTALAALHAGFAVAILAASVLLAVLASLPEPGRSPDPAAPQAALAA